MKFEGKFGLICLFVVVLLTPVFFIPPAFGEEIKEGQKKEEKGGKSDFPTYKEVVSRMSVRGAGRGFMMELDEKTARAIKKLVTDFPEDTRLNYGAGEMFSSIGVKLQDDNFPEGLKAEAEKCYRRALKVDPGNGEIRSRMVQFYLDNRDQWKIEAINELKRLKGIDPGNALHNYQRAYIYFLDGNDNGAMKEINEADSKYYLDTYDDGGFKARVEMLEKIGYPHGMARMHALLRIRISSFAVVQKIADNLMRIGRQKEDKEKVEEAISTYEKLVSLGKRAKVRSKYLMLDLLSQDTRLRGLRAQADCYQAHKLSDREALVREEMKLIEGQNEAFRSIVSGVQGKMMMMGTAEDELKQHFDDVLLKGELAVLKKQRERSRLLAGAIYEGKSSGKGFKIENPEVMKVSDNGDGTKTVSFSDALKIKFSQTEVVSTVDPERELIIDRNAILNVKQKTTEEMNSGMPDAGRF